PRLAAGETVGGLLADDAERVAGRIFHDLPAPDAILPAGAGSLHSPGFAAHRIGLEIQMHAGIALDAPPQDDKTTSRRLQRNVALPGPRPPRRRYAERGRPECQALLEVLIQAINNDLSESAAMHGILLCNLHDLGWRLQPTNRPCNLSTLLCWLHG